MNTEKTKHQKSIGAIFITSLIMFWVMIGFTGAIFLSIILSIIAHKVLQKKPDLQKHTTGLSVFLVILTFVGIFAPAAKQDAEFRETNQEIVSGESTTHQYVTSVDTFERTVELIALDVLGADTLIERIEVSNNELNIEYILSENLTTNMTRRGLMMDSEELIKSLTSSLPTEITVVNFSSSLHLIDQYGNTELTKVGLVTFNKSTWEKINWDNFLTDNIPTVADYYWVHPALNS